MNNVPINSYPSSLNTDMQSDVMRIAKERMMKLRMEAERQDAENQREEERKYYEYKKMVEEPPIQYNNPPVSDRYRAECDRYNGPGEQEPPGKYDVYGKYESGGGGDRSGYRNTEQDYLYSQDEPYTTNDQYTVSTNKRHSDVANSHSSGVIGHYQDDDDDEVVRRDNRMRSMLSDGYNDPSAGEMRSDSGRLSGRKSGAQYGDVTEARNAKRLQQQQYREEIAKAASSAPIEGERYAKFRSDRDYRDEGINLPGNSMGKYPPNYGNQGYGPASRGNSCGGGRSNLVIG